MPHQPLRAMIVEDEELTLMLLRHILSRAGYEVVGQAENGKEAIAVARETQPDFILMDFNMPIMNGSEATREIMAERPVPIILVTGYNDSNQVALSMEAGACAYVVKPVNSANLLPVIKRCFAPVEEDGREQ